MKRIILSISIMSLLIFLVSANTIQQPKPSTTSPKTSAKKASNKKKPTPKVVKQADSVITWYNMSDGYAKAVKENKILIVDVYTDWCYWCKVMDKKTYEDKEIVAKINEYAIAVKFNPEVNGNHVVNGEIMNSGQLLNYLNKGGRNSGYPTTFFWKKLTDSKAIASYPGFREAPEFNTIINSFIQQ
jgi:thioredoxin-related protein